MTTMIVWCFKNACAAEGYSPDDILLFEDMAKDVEPYLNTLAGVNGRWKSAFCLTAGTSKTTTYCLAKFLQYREGAAQVCACQGTSPQQVELFRMWEDLCSTYEAIHPEAVEGKIKELETALARERFWGAAHRLIYALRRYARTTHPDLLPECLEHYTNTVADNFAFPIQTNLDAATTSIVAAEKDIAGARMTVLGHVKELREFLEAWQKVGSKTVAFTHFSCLSYYRALHVLSQFDFNCAIILAHRAVDLFLAGHCKSLADVRKWRFMLEKYGNLVQTGVLSPNTTVEQQLAELNEYRNRCFLAHGTWTVSEATTKKLISQTRSAIETITGTPSIWSYAMNKLKKPAISATDIFAFEPGPEMFIEKTTI